jgi:hypothetical protein
LFGRLKSAHFGSTSAGENGGDDGTRTRDLCRDSVAVFGFTTT